MKVFISHAQKDAELAQRLSRRLAEAGFDVWTAAEQIFPGENWALKMGKALAAADLMVVLLTPGAASDESVRRDVEFAIAGSRFKDRLLPVFVGANAKRDPEVPWILLKLPHVQLPRDTDFSEVLEQLAVLTN